MLRASLKWFCCNLSCFASTIVPSHILSDGSEDWTEITECDICARLRPSKLGRNISILIAGSSQRLPSSSNQARIDTFGWVRLSKHSSSHTTAVETSTSTPEPPCHPLKTVSRHQAKLKHPQQQPQPHPHHHPTWPTKRQQ